MRHPADVGRRVRHDARGDSEHAKYSKNGREMPPCGSFSLVASLLVASPLVARHISESSIRPRAGPHWRAQLHADYQNDEVE